MSQLIWIWILWLTSILLISLNCNFIARYDKDMRKLDKKILKMAEMDKKGVEYDEKEVEVTESEGEG